MQGLLILFMSSMALSAIGEDMSASFPNTDIHLEADAPLAVSQHFSPDNTLAGHTAEDNPKNIHTCLIVQNTQPIPTLTLTTKITTR